jgi:hypothetical protein
MKRYISFILIIIMLIAMAAPVFAGEHLYFKDLIISGNKNWAYDTIMKLANSKVINGMPDGTYKPELSVTREQFVKLLVEAIELEKTNRSTFDDIDKSWAKQYIETAVKEGIIIPSEVGNSFRPTEPITRKDVAYMVARGLRIEPYKVWQPTSVYPYNDTYDPTIAKLYGEYLLNGVIRNSSRYFDPDRDMTRAEAAVIIDRVMEYKKDKAAYKEGKKNELIKSLVKGDVDLEFEKFVNSEEGAKFASNRYFTAKNGVIIFNEFGGWDYGDIIVENPGYKAINKAIYNTIKDLVSYAKKNNQYVHTWFVNGSVVVALYEDYNMGINAANLGSFRVHFYVSPKKLDNTKQLSYLSWSISRLWYVADFNDLDKEIPAINYTQDKFLLPMQSAFKNIYGDIDGQEFYEYAVGEYRLDNVKEGKYINQSISTLNGIEIKNYNDNSLKVEFITNVKGR